MPDLKLLQKPDGKTTAARSDASGQQLVVEASAASTKSVLAPVAAPVSIARTDLTTAIALASLPCVRGFWLSNPGTVRIYYALASGTAVTATGANCTGFVEPGERKWFGYANANLLQLVSSSGTAQYCVDGE